MFPEALIRLCQFHIIQAIARADFFIGDVSLQKLAAKVQQSLKAGKHRIVIGTDTRKKIENAFRKVQRYRGESVGEPWSVFRHRFGEDIRVACEEDMVEEEAAEAILEYFDDYWFCSRWRGQYLVLIAGSLLRDFVPLDLATDAGLPPGQTKDGSWNTNNWVEASFRTFKFVFLEQRRNKRIDRLLTIILEDFFPYYRYWELDEPRLSKQLLRVSRAGQYLWSSGHVLPERGDGELTKFDVLSYPSTKYVPNTKFSTMLILGAVLMPRRLFILWI